MRYEDLPTFWKKQISSSINYAITDLSPVFTVDEALSIWLDDRFKREDDGRLIYTMSMKAPNRQSLEIDEELFQELQEIFRQRREKHVKKKLERQAERERATPATAKQKAFIQVLLEKHAKEFKLAKPLETLNIGEAARIIRFLKYPDFLNRPEDLVIQLKPVVRGRVIPFPKRR